MPLSTPGTLPPKTSFEIIAYILSFNGFHAGTTPIAESDLDRLVAPPQTGKSVAAASTRAPTPPNVPVSQPMTHIVSQAELDAADTDSTNWLTYNKGYKGFRYSALDQINANNAAELRAVCVMQLGEIGTFQTGPLIYDGPSSRRSTRRTAFISRLPRARTVSCTLSTARREVFATKFR
jgi:alcohol dehydrogenase (cytochrome c)